MSDAWILPRGTQSILIRRAEVGTYRARASSLVEVGPVPMPVRAVHRLDEATDTLVYADAGKLTVVRELSGARAASALKVPGKPRIHALMVIDEVVFTGGDAGKGMLGWVDLRAPLAWKPIAVPDLALGFGKGVDGFALHGGRLIAIDDIVLPRYILVIDVNDPRAPRLLETRDLPAHSSAERVTSVAANADTAALLSTSANHGACSAHVSFLDLETLEEWAALHVERPGGFRRWSDRTYDLHAVALERDRLLVAAGKDGIGVLPIPPRPANLAARARRQRHDMSSAAQIPAGDLRFVPVPAGPVIDVVPVDEERAFAVVEAGSEKIFQRRRLDSVLVPLPPGSASAPPG